MDHSNDDHFARLREDDFVLEALPDDLADALEKRDELIATLPRGSGGFEFFVSDLQRWNPGMVVTVAFLGGSTELHRDIAEVASAVTDGCNLDLDFGFDEVTGEFRTWSEDETEHSALIRVSFDQRGFFSLVGTDSADPDVGSAFGSVGGRPGQRSLNLGGFHIKRPLSWKGTVRHEFLHALAFHHEHQNFQGPCEDDFRWEDDTGYLHTTDPAGRVIADPQGRQPGIYSFLAGFPNQWDKGKVDHNLRTTASPSTVGVSVGDFDNASVMLYPFPQLFYKSNPSECAPTTDGESMSDGDRDGLCHLYPLDRAAVQAIGSHSSDLADLVGAGGAGADPVNAPVSFGLTAEPSPEPSPGEALAAKVAAAMSDRAATLR